MIEVPTAGGRVLMPVPDGWERIPGAPLDTLALARPPEASTDIPATATLRGIPWADSPALLPGAVLLAGLSGNDGRELYPIDVTALTCHDADVSVHFHTSAFLAGPHLGIVEHVVAAVPERAIILELERGLGEFLLEPTLALDLAETLAWSALEDAPRELEVVPLDLPHIDAVMPRLPLGPVVPRIEDAHAASGPDAPYIHSVLAALEDATTVIHTRNRDCHRCGVADFVAGPNGVASDAGPSRRAMLANPVPVTAEAHALTAHSPAHVPLALLDWLGIGASTGDLRPVAGLDADVLRKRVAVGPAMPLPDGVDPSAARLWRSHWCEWDVTVAGRPGLSMHGLTIAGHGVLYLDGLPDPATPRQVFLDLAALWRAALTPDRIAA